jgi:hypothetical protein
MDTIAAIHARRSIRDYAPRAVEQSLIEAVIDDAAQAPWTPLSASEPWVFTRYSRRGAHSCLRCSCVAVCTRQPTRLGRMYSSGTDSQHCSCRARPRIMLGRRAGAMAPRSRCLRRACHSRRVYPPRGLHAGLRRSHSEESGYNRDKDKLDW